MTDTTPPLPLAAIRSRLDGPALLYACLIGSHAYGLARPDSDIDVRAVYLAPTERFLGLTTPPDTVTDGDGTPGLDDFTAFELAKFIHLGLTANPNVLEWWFADSGTGPVWSDARMGPLLEARPRLLSQRARTAYVGFATSQITRAERALEGNPTGRMQDKTVAKHLLHCVRLLEAGEQLMRTGTLIVAATDPQRLRALAAQPLEQVRAHFEQLRERIDTAPTPLPPEPDTELFDALLRQVRLASL